ncbi:right-handed parallel beta-helix repeat-containing protein [Micromonospora cathayae]|uniref:Right-handed parallel beta-helix repeat-containing protein n=1 Tax=Micromonospora cathayae TaxID=3028804 RepID=A0ABY7ZKL3_9ACTN|nr:LamG-like jellyroll fold domain-containing protein [Micromonospora sp. HUAS 3]WDZ83413.1 right-handed parallel beta-helix repeat-containing protein [Micromonospora sp. HUAS 3]
MRPSRQRRLALLLAAVLVPAAALVVGFTSTASAATVFSDDFADGDTSGWSKSGGTWAVVTDGSPAAQQSNAGSENARLFAGSTSWTAYTVQARVKPLSLGATGHVSLLARASGSTVHYRLALLSGNRVQLQAVSGSSVTVLASAARTITTGTWYTLAIDVTGTTVRGSVDGTTIGQATSSLVSAGRIGLQTAYSSASFDDVVVSTGGTTPTTPPATTAPPTTPPATTAPPTTPPATTAPPPAAGTLYVATNGNDANPGTLSQPLLTIQRAHDLVQPGGTIAVRGGTYAPSVTIKILKDGTASQPITLTSYNGERVIIDGENMPYTPGAVDSSIPRPDRGALHVEGDWWRFVGLEIVNGPYGIFGLDTNNGRYERLVTRDNYESGLHIQGASSNNHIIDLDSYGNRDPRKNGESADGLAIKEGSGTGNVVRGARLWRNADDGFDAWLFLSPILIENSVAYDNGYNYWNLPNYTGDGNGFKNGGGNDPRPAVAHTTRNSMAWGNSAGGFIDNGNPGSLVFERNTAWDNGKAGFDVSRSTSVVNRNLSVGNGTNVSLGNSTGSNNSWNLGGTWTFVSTDPATITGPRAADGSIPTSPFLRPTNGADVGARL